MTAYRAEFGRRWDVRIPRSQLKWLMGQISVGTPDAIIEMDVRERCRKNPAFDERLTRLCVAYALAAMAQNRALYRAVMSGTL